VILRGSRGVHVPVALVVIALLVIGCTSVTPAPPASGSGGTGSSASGKLPVTVAGYYAQKLHWTPCHKDFQCARLLVPYDYNRPAWRRFSLPVIRLPASDRRARIGSLVVNPGGPGGSGISYALQAPSEIAAPMLARFDIVGFDPRGVGGSEPAVHCLTGPQLDKYFATNDTPHDRAQLSAVIDESQLFARACQRNSGSLLPYVGTRNAARDMDVLRAVLGDKKLTYLGKSYGTYLGTWYAELFPQHIRAMVLDGALNPDASSLSMNVIQGEGFEVALHAFVADCLRRIGCPLGQGGPVKAGVARIQALLNQVARRPLTSNIGDGRPAGPALILNGIVAALYSQTYWGTLRTALQAAFRGDGTVLVELGNLLYERNGRGQYTNLADANMAVNCLDRPWPRTLARWRSAAALAARKAPQFGAAIMWGSLPCAYWPVRSYPLPKVKAKGAPPILVVGNKRDPATPYRWAQELARDLQSGVLLGWNGNGHTAYMMGSACVNYTVDNYLIGRQVPSNGTVCP
jgi:pimeloyl-ACP methyl ester carboxylesterase